MKHYCLNSSNEVELCAGGLLEEIEVEALKAYIKRNKKLYIPREESQLDKIVKQYNEKFTFGKHINRTVEEVFNEDKKWLVWCKNNFNFSGKEKLKEQITEILKT